MTRVIHTGDTHVGYQQYHSPERRRDFLDAFRQVVDDAVSEEVDAVVHAGDLFHDRRPELPDLMGVLSALRTLDDADIPFLAIVGNHESTRSGEWLDLFRAMGLATRLGAEPTVVGNTAFYGLDWVPRSRRDELDYEFDAHDAEFATLVAHGQFAPLTREDWDAREVLDAANLDFDALLLGDEHKPDTTEVEETWVTYCGSTERASASEEEARGYNLVSFERRGSGDGLVDIRRRSLDTREFVYVTADLAEGEGVERVREQVRQHDLEDAVAIVEITGEGEPVTPAAVEEAGADAGALITRVTDRREVEEHDTEVQVSFADPDDAVRERVADLGLSTAAHDVDETVRASKTADSNVRDEVRERVESLLADGTGAFEPADEELTGDVEADGEADGEVGTDTDGLDDLPDEAPEAGVGADAEADEDAGADEAAEPDDRPDPTDGQITMEDF